MEGINFHTTLDIDLMEAAKNAAQTALPYLDELQSRGYDCVVVFHNASPLKDGKMAVRIMATKKLETK